MQKTIGSIKFNVNVKDKKTLSELEQACNDLKKNVSFDGKGQANIEKITWDVLNESFKTTTKTDFGMRFYSVAFEMPLNKIILITNNSRISEIVREKGKELLCFETNYALYSLVIPYSKEN